MVSLAALWLPLLLSAVVVFIVSSIIHSVLPWHKGDLPAPPNQDSLMAAMRPFAIPPGDYMMPRAASAAEMKDPAYLEKLRQGPVVLMTVHPNGPFTMGKQLALWFGYCLLVNLVAAYIGGRALGPGAEYLEVFRFVGTTAFAGYTLALWQGHIWFGRSLGYTLRSSIDGLVYALATAGIFGSMWPG